MSVQVGTTSIERGVLLVSIAQSAMWLSCLTSIYSRRRLRKRRERSGNHRLRHRVLAACYLANFSSEGMILHLCAYTQHDRLA